MLSFYRQRFSNAADFAFFMVGAFKVDEVLPLVAQYVGGLPSIGPARSDVKDVGIHFPSATVREQVEMRREPRATVQISFFAESPADPVEAENSADATTVLDIALPD